MLIKVGSLMCTKLVTDSDPFISSTFLREVSNGVLTIRYLPCNSGESFAIFFFVFRHIMLSISSKLLFFFGFVIWLFLFRVP